MDRSETYGPIYQACRRLPCVLKDHPDHRAACGGGGDAHHVKRVGAGGRDVWNVVPVCRRLHHSCHGLGGTERDVEQSFEISLAQLAVATTGYILKNKLHERFDGLES